MSDRDVRKLPIEAKKDPQKTARELQQQAGPSTQAVSVRTIQRVRENSVIKSYRPRKVPFLTKIQRLRRFHLAKEMTRVSEDSFTEGRQNGYSFEEENDYF